MALAVIAIYTRDLAARFRTNTIASQAEYIDAPAQWVAFTADVKITTSGGRDVLGKFYRSSEGSTRLQTGPSSDDVRVIFIRNVSQATIFDWSAGQWWREPLKDAGFFRTPPRVRKTRNWAPYPYRLAIQKGQDGSITSSEGFEAYRVASNNGVIKIKVAALNLFDAVIQRGDGRYEAYTNVELGEPPADLFQPPESATIKDRPIRLPSGAK